MALFKDRETGRILTAERVLTALQVETETKGWVTVGGGMWVVRSAGPGPKPDVYEDPQFRVRFEALDADARAHLAKPMPRVPGATYEDAPAPPNYMAAQNLPPVQTATEFAAQQQARKAAVPAPAPAKAAAAPLQAPADADDVDILGMGSGLDDIAIP